MAIRYVTTSEGIVLKIEVDDYDLARADEGDPIHGKVVGVIVRKSQLDFDPDVGE